MNYKDLPCVLWGTWQENYFVVLCGCQPSELGIKQKLDGKAKLAEP